MNVQTTITPSITCGNCHGTHHSVYAVKECYGLVSNDRVLRQVATGSQAFVAAVTQEAAPTATEKQVAFIAKLREERGLPELDFTGSKKQASEEISRLLALPKVSVVIEKAHEDVKQVYREITEGIWKADNADGTDDIYKVYYTVHGANVLAVKRLTRREGKKGSFKYLGAARRFLPGNAVKMTLEEAAAFGKLYGFCIRCGRTLTDEGSIAAGIGPICAGKGYWG